LTAIPLRTTYNHRQFEAGRCLAGILHIVVRNRTRCCPQVDCCDREVCPDGLESKVGQAPSGKPPALRENSNRNINPSDLYMRSPTRESFFAAGSIAWRALDLRPQ